MRRKIVPVPFVLLCASTAAIAWPHISVHVSPPHISAPHISAPHIPVIKAGPIAITPIGPVPKQLVAPVKNALNTVAGGVTHTAIAIGKAQIAPTVAITNVISGREDFNDAAQAAIKGQGKPIEVVGQAVSDTNAAVHNVEVVAAESIAGNVGKTTLNIVDGPTQLGLEFATTAAIEAGEISTGNLQPDRLAAEPLAAALRTAYNQYKQEAKPMPEAVRAALAPFFPPQILANARWTISNVSLAVPDLIDQGQKTFEGNDFAVTVGNITVFNRDPDMSLHWWAHELQHQVQYSRWGIDEFAYRYVTSCHTVESEAEAKAQASIPAATPTAVAC